MFKQVTLVMVCLVFCIFLTMWLREVFFMSKYYQVNIYLHAPDPAHRKIFGVLIKDETPVDYFVRYKQGLPSGHTVDHTLLNWFELTEDDFNKMKEFESYREKPTE